jgi:hypothetical protein
MENSYGYIGRADPMFWLILYWSVSFMSPIFTFISARPSQKLFIGYIFFSEEKHFLKYRFVTVVSFFLSYERHS